MDNKKKLAILLKNSSANDLKRIIFNYFWLKKELFLGDRKMNLKETNNLQFATFNERLKPGFMDYFGPFILFFVGALIQTPLFLVGVFSIIMGSIVEILGLFALLFINGYVPALNRGQTPNKLKAGVKMMKIVDKETMELREINDGDLVILLLRAFIGWFELFIPFPLLLPYLIISSNKYNQRLADMIAGTVVVCVEPVEEFSLKDFRMKKSDPYPEGEAFATTTKSSIAVSKETRVAKETAEAGINTSLFNIGKIILLISSIILIICFVGFVIVDIVRTVDRSLYIFGGADINPQAAYILNDVLRILSYIIFFASCAGLIALTLSLESEDRIFFYIASGLYLIFIILLIIKENILYANFIYLGTINFVNAYYPVVTVGGFVLDILNAVLIVTMFFVLNSGIKKITEKYPSNIKPFKAQIALIVFILLWIIIIIIGSAAGPEAIFATVIFYLRELFGYCIVITYAVIFGRLMKLRKISA